jgi:hypothetical protein
MISDDDLTAAFGGVRVRFWLCPVEEHRHPISPDGWPTPTVEWDGDVAYCLTYHCGRSSLDPVPRGECLCDGTRNAWGTECTGQCCGPGQCSCSLGGDQL